MLKSNTTIIDQLRLHIYICIGFIVGRFWSYNYAHICVNIEIITITPIIITLWEFISESCRHLLITLQ